MNQQAQTNAQREQTQIEKKFVVWRSKRNIKRGEVVTKSDLERTILQQQDANKLGINDDVTIELPDNTRASQTINAGQYVFNEMFLAPDQAGYLDLIASKGKILYPLTIYTTNLIDNYISPGDNIDILAVSSPVINLSETNKKITQYQGLRAYTIMRRVKILAFFPKAITTQIKEYSTSNQPINPTTSTNDDLKTTVIVEVEPKFVSLLSLAQITMHLEIYRSQQNRIPSVDIGKVIENFQSVRELRGEQQEQITDIETY
ncbi:Flp pilus assembly protein CpaB [Vibrio mediterranei]